MPNDDDSLQSGSSTYRLTIRDRFHEAQRGDRIVIWRPAGRRFTPVRTLGIEMGLYRTLNHPWGTDEEPAEALRQEVLAVCDAFVSGRVTLFQVAKMLGGRKGTAQLLVMKPNPGYRLIGGFLDDDVFLATCGYRRDELPHKPRPEQTAKAAIDYETINEITHRAVTALLPEAQLMTPTTLGKQHG